jgi:hypothetical protein
MSDMFLKASKTYVKDFQVPSGIYLLSMGIKLVCICSHLFPEIKYTRDMTG